MRSWTLAVGSWLGTSFYNLDLSNVNFTGAKLPNTDLRAKKLYRTCFQGVVGLERARVDNRYLDLAYPKVQKLLTHQSSPDPNFRSFNLRGAYLQGKDMRGFDFTEANLTGADCKDAKLQNANFTHAQIIDVDFTNANLTGICIADWSVNDQTKFTNVQCDYVYRKLDENDNPTDRFPCDRNFEPREFESLYQEIGNVAELIFKEGVNWRAFAFTLQKLQLEDEGLGLQLKGIEKRGDLWVVKVTHNEDIPTAQVEQQLKANYGNLQRQLANKEQQINQLLGIVSNQAESLKELSKKPFGNYFTITGSTITNLAGGQIEYTEAAAQIRSLVAGSSNQQPMTSVAQTFLEQLQNQNIATSPDTQMELIKQIILSEAQKDKIFGQFLLQQGQQILDTMPNSAIASAIQAAIAQLRIEVVE
ncbi:MAG: pentapeptide repeat-containing protein [Symploca sp. SIO1C2]|nr:pentapeptide repeat-containing protein [Symploca sp. SIO1C2]